MPVRSIREINRSLAIPMYEFPIPNSKFLIPPAPAGVRSGAGDLAAP